MNNENIPSIDTLEDIIKDIKVTKPKSDSIKSINDEKKAIMLLFDEIDRLKQYIKAITEELLIKKII